MKHKILLILLFVSLFSLPLQAADRSFHPVDKVKEWIKDGKGQKGSVPNLLSTLSTVGSDLRPHTAPIKIAKINKKEGFLFFTRKGTPMVNNLDLNPLVNLHICLPKIHKHIFIDGKVETLSEEILQKRWKGLSRSMKLTFLSDQDSKFKAKRIKKKKGDQRVDKSLEAEEIPMPNTFVGYSLLPDQILFHSTRGRGAGKKELIKLEEDAWTIFNTD